MAFSFMLLTPFIVGMSLLSLLRPGIIVICVRAYSPSADPSQSASNQRAADVATSRARPAAPGGGKRLLSCDSRHSLRNLAAALAGRVSHNKRLPRNDRETWREWE
jgi:hypothetical protein